MIHRFAMYLFKPRAANSPKEQVPGSSRRHLRSEHGDGDYFPLHQVQGGFSIPTNKECQPSREQATTSIGDGGIVECPIARPKRSNMEDIPRSQGKEASWPEGIVWSRRVRIV